MASALYTDFKEELLKGTHDLLNDTIKVVLIDAADYTFSAAHTQLSQVAAGAQVASATLAGVSVTNGVVDASDTTVSSVSGDEFEAVILYNDTDANDALICYIDSITATTPNGNDILITWDNGANKIFSL